MTTFYDKPEKYFVIAQLLFMIFVIIFKDVFIVTIIIYIFFKFKHVVTVQYVYLAYYEKKRK